jgi:hypothetical protein
LFLPCLAAVLLWQPHALGDLVIFDDMTGGAVVNNNSHDANYRFSTGVSSVRVVRTVTPRFRRILDLILLSQTADVLGNTFLLGRGADVFAPLVSVL